MATPLLHRTLRCTPRPSHLLRRRPQPLRPARSTGSGGSQGFGSVFPNPPPPLQRRADRPLPSLRAITRRWPPYLAPFLAVLALSAAAVINYEKGQHSVVASCLYALRVNERVRARLGDEIYFAHRVPWISGSIDPMHGKIDITFWVKGTKGRGMMQFRCTRRKRKEFFTTEIWTLQFDDGEVMDLLEGGHVVDPMTASDLHPKP